MTTLHRRLAGTALALSLLLAACTSDGGPEPNGTTPANGVVLSVQVASYEVLSSAPNRFIVGLLAQEGEDSRFVSWGSVQLRFGFRGTAQEPADEPYGDPVEAAFLPVPGETTGEPPSGGPLITNPSEGRGVYAAYDLPFDRAGFWEVEVTAEIEGTGTLTGTGALEVLAEPRIPAPGQDAPKSENLTLASTDEPPEAIDSRAQDGQAIPDPELHGTTVARAIAEGRPALIVISTPVYCVSRFCGPVTDVVQDLAARFEDRAAFIHIEVWRDHDAQTVNAAAAEWILRDGGLTEPWLFLVGADGTILRRWDNMFTEDEVAEALEALPSLD